MKKESLISELCKKEASFQFFMKEKEVEPGQTVLAYGIHGKIGDREAELWDPHIPNPKKEKEAPPLDRPRMLFEAVVMNLCLEFMRLEVVDGEQE
jgi:hypothetical protein